VLGEEPHNLPKMPTLPSRCDRFLVRASQEPAAVTLRLSCRRHYFFIDRSFRRLSRDCGKERFRIQMETGWAQLHLSVPADLAGIPEYFDHSTDHRIRQRAKALDGDADSIARP